MKRIALLIIVSIALLANEGIAQNRLANRSSGPKVGINLSNVYDSEGENFHADAKVGLVAGLFLSMPLGSIFAFQPEMLFSQKGFTASGSILGNNYTFTRTLNYIDVPLLGAVKPSKMFTILAGPQYSILINKKDVFKNSFLSIEQEEEFYNDDLRRSTLCFLGGIDVSLNRFVIGARVGWDLLQNNSDGTSTTPRYKNVWYQATIGFLI
jgi:hypothetical protein